MFAKCCRSVPNRALTAIPEVFRDKANAGIHRPYVRFYDRSPQDGRASGGHDVKIAGQKLSWPRHPQHRLPSSWPYTVAVATPAEARRVVLQLDEGGRTLLLEQLKKLEEEKAALAGDSGEVPPVVTKKQLIDVFMFNGFPFIGFGILDNGIMIVAGEYIDVTIGTALGISTMAAAALGNLISDVAGVGSAGYIETFVSKIGIKIPDITPAQSDFTSVRWAVGLGRAIGISIGCLIGMLPLLFFVKKDDDADGDKSDSSPSPTPTPTPTPSTG